MPLRGIISPQDPDPQHGWRPDPTQATALLPAANRPLAEHAARALAAAGAQDAFVVGTAAAVAVLAEVLGDGARFGLPLTYVVEERPGLVTALAATGLAGTGDAAVVHRCGGLLEAPISGVDEVRSGRADALLLLHPGGDALDLETRRTLRLLDAAGPRDGLAGVCVLGPAVLAAVAELERPGLELAEVLGAVAGGGGIVSAMRVGGWHDYRGRAEDLLTLNRMALEQLPPTPHREWPPHSSINGRVDIDPSATLEHVVIRGPVVIGPGARLRHAYVGPYTAIGEHVCIEGAEIEHSIILPGAHILHIQRRLDGSVVGRDARIHQDFSLPRGLRLQVGNGVDVCLC